MAKDWQICVELPAFWNWIFGRIKLFVKTDLRKSAILSKPFSSCQVKSEPKSSNFLKGSNNLRCPTWHIQSMKEKSRKGKKENERTLNKSNQYQKHTLDIFHKMSKWKIKVQKTLNFNELEMLKRRIKKMPPVIQWEISRSRIIDERRKKYCNHRIIPS